MIHATASHFLAANDAGQVLTWILALACLALVRSHVLLGRSVKSLQGRVEAIADIAEFPEGPDAGGQSGTVVVGTVPPPPPPPAAAAAGTDDLLSRWRRRRSQHGPIRQGGFSQ